MISGIANTPIGTVAGTITAVASVLMALATVLGALPLLIKTWRQSKAIHVIVNQQRTDSQRYQAALIQALKNAGIDVPVDQSIEIVETEGDNDNGRPSV